MTIKEEPMDKPNMLTMYDYVSLHGVKISYRLM